MYGNQETNLVLRSFLSTLISEGMGPGDEFRRSNFCKDHRDKTEEPDPLVLEDLISDKLNNRRK